jgi:hypothetical protein
MTRPHLRYRAPPHVTALGAATVFVPLFAALLFWVFVHRVAPMPQGSVLRPEHSLPPLVAILAAAFAAGGAALLSALILANVARLGALFRPRRSKFVTAAILALITPVAVRGLWGVPFASDAWHHGGFFRFVGLWVVIGLAWYPGTTILVSGIRSKLLRVFAFALIWWQIWGIAVMIEGFRAPMFH